MAEACDPLALVTIVAKVESNKFQRRSNFLFPLLLSVPSHFQLGAHCLGEQVMVPKEENKPFFSDLFQSPTLKGKLKGGLCRNNITDL